MILNAVCSFSLGSAKMQHYQLDSVIPGKTISFSAFHCLIQLTAQHALMQRHFMDQVEELNCASGAR